jgi:hypothetical protein
MHIVDPQKLVAKLSSRPQPPAIIPWFQDQIDGQIRLLELRTSLQDRSATNAEINYIVLLKRMKDELYARWLEDQQLPTQAQLQDLLLW